MNFKFSPQITLMYLQVIYKNQGLMPRDKRVMHNQTEKCLIINNFFPTGPKMLIFSMCVTCILNIVHIKNQVKIAFGFGYMDVSFLKTVPFLNEQLCYTAKIWSGC